VSCPGILSDDLHALGSAAPAGLPFLGRARGRAACKMPGTAEVDRFWPGISSMVCLGTIGYIMLLSVWTIFINFISDEAHQPLDFYSNKLRTKPYWLVIELVVLGGGIAGVYQTNQMKVLNEGLPEVAIACYLQGLVIAFSTSFGCSAATSLTAMLLYFFVGPALCMVTLVPTLPMNRPGVFYGVIFFIVNVIFVAWVRVGVRRHVNRDGASRILPPGAERLFELWCEAVFKWNPLLATLTSLIYGVEHLQFVGEYGWACALGFYVIAFLLLAGCCRQFKTGTELE